MGRIRGQNQILKKYGFREHDLMRIKGKVAGVGSDKWKVVRRRLHTIEGHATKKYFKQIFQLLPKPLSIKRRRTYKAYDGINNTFNLAYTVLKWKAYRAIIRSV